ncbi:MAG: NAD-dependent epimerase/dehydratase family protein [Coriobacteriia bacterium]|jgi:UDP-glucose 4-epimerase|nr:NAD-dependent epimerase/dehydratase family protein [Coriobacteriia bacterium]
MRVLVTGGAGFIGSNLVHVLLGSHEVGVIDDLSTGRPANLHPAAWNRTMDILDERLSSTVAEFQPEVVVHLAAQASVPRSIIDPVRDWEVNVDGTRRVAQAAAAAGARRVISASSAAVYGEPAELPLRESSTTVPVNPYGSSKLAAEGALADTLAGTATDFASMRFSNVYGPRQDAEGEGGVVAIFCSELAAGRAPKVLGSGGQTRDFIYVADVVTALMAAAEYGGELAETSGGAAFNVSTGQEISVNTLANTLRPIADYFGSFETGPARAGDIERSVLDPSKIHEVLGWEAQVPLEVGLTPTYRWFSGR